MRAILLACLLIQVLHKEKCLSLALHDAKAVAAAEHDSGRALSLDADQGASKVFVLGVMVIIFKMHPCMHSRHAHLHTHTFMAHT